MKFFRLILPVFSPDSIPVSGLRQRAAVTILPERRVSQILHECRRLPIASLR